MASFLIAGAGDGDGAGAGFAEDALTGDALTGEAFAAAGGAVDDLAGADGVAAREGTDAEAATTADGLRIRIGVLARLPPALALGLGAGVPAAETGLALVVVADAAETAGAADAAEFAPEFEIEIRLV